MKLLLFFLWWLSLLFSNMVGTKEKEPPMPEYVCHYTYASSWIQSPADAASAHYVYYSDGTVDFYTMYQGQELAYYSFVVPVDKIEKLQRMLKTNHIKDKGDLSTNADDGSDRYIIVTDEKGNTYQSGGHCPSDAEFREVENYIREINEPYLEEIAEEVERYYKENNLFQEW